MRRVLPFTVFAAVVLLAVLTAPQAVACPPCANFAQWQSTPCLTTNCSPCGYCSYCCGRFGIGCENCDYDLTASSPACADLDSETLSTPMNAETDATADSEAPAEEVGETTATAETATGDRQHQEEATATPASE